MSDKQVKLAIIGTGSRGLNSYSPHIVKMYPKAKIVAIAEPDPLRRNKAAEQLSLTKANCFESWQELLSQDKMADAVVIATQDPMHKDPAVAAAEKGYHVLLEKPMATTLRDCLEITEAVEKNNVSLTICHVLRYAPYYKKIKDIIDSGALGDICTLQHLEGVAWWHFAHSYVRGNWGNTKESSFMLLAKSCHDLDLIQWWIGKKCLHISSFGSLKHFRKTNKPDNSASRCMDCPLSDQVCPYSAKKFYFEKLRSGDHGWPLSVLIEDFNEEALSNALREGPYGRCVYDCDNDVVDHQVVSMEFDDAITASFVMTAFTPHGRASRIMGSKGYLEGDEKSIKVLDFASNSWTRYDTSSSSTDLSGGHGGGDNGLIHDFIDTLTDEKKLNNHTGCRQALYSHLMVFAAEQSRLDKATINIDSFCKKHSINYFQ